MVTKAMALTENHNMIQIVVVDKDNRPAGLFHSHELLEAGKERNEW
jgi:Mg/Co/Ni transporter MgtE